MTQSGDAFGQSVGGERTGLYSPEDVRGFDPVDAGNARIEGLYFDQVDRLPGRVIDANRIRVGLSTQGFAFPAPTGLVEYRLTKPKAQAEGNFDLQLENFFGPGLTIEGSVPLLGDSVGISGGFQVRRFQHPEGSSHRAYNYGATIGVRPYVGAEVLAFGGEIITRGEEARPTLFPAGSFVPPNISRRTNLRQPWSDRATNISTIGSIAALPLGRFRVEMGLFRSRRVNIANFSDIMNDVSEVGAVGRRTIVADAGSFDQSLSGEVRLIHQWTNGAFTHRLAGSVRGRSKDRLFGGSQRISLGPSTALAPDVRPIPAYTIGPKNRDDVFQIAAGVGYSVAWNDRATLDLGISKIKYRKTVDFADPLAFDPVTRDSPLTWNAFLSIAVTPAVRVFAGATRGQEEALIAPDVATNRSEAPPAIQTSQIEAGARVAVSTNLTLVTGIFVITKPYYNLDTTLRYRQLGDVSNRGVEFSLTGSIAPGLTLVAGTVFTDPRISGELVQSGQIGPMPVGQVKRRSVASVDWRQDEGRGDFSVDLKVENISARMANALNTFSAPGFTTIDIGARYRFSAAGMPMVIRPEVLNVLNTYAWRVSGSGGFSYINPRTFSVSLVGDF